MKLRVGDTVRVVAGKSKGLTGPIMQVNAVNDTVIVKDANKYTRHIKPMGGQDGRKAELERPLSTAKVAIINDKGEVDRIGYSVAKDGTKTRIFKKTGKPVPAPKQETK